MWKGQKGVFQTGPSSALMVIQLGETPLCPFHITTESELGKGIRKDNQERETGKENRKANQQRKSGKGMSPTPDLLA